MATRQTVSEHYCNGILEGRKALKKYGVEIAHDELRNLNSTIKGFPASTPVGQFLRGELDFWRHQLARVGGAA